MLRGLPTLSARSGRLAANMYRIADQLRIEPGMVDVVIVDEASQAGLEATFLQYLAPRMS